VIAPGETVVCILTGHQLKDPTATVAYHSTDQKTFDDVLGKCAETVRLPMVPVADKTRAAVRDAMVHAGLIN